jgi:hypothetical protein
MEGATAGFVEWARYLLQVSDPLPALHMWKERRPEPSLTSLFLPFGTERFLSSAVFLSISLTVSRRGPLQISVCNASPIISSLHASVNPVLTQC